MVARNVILNFHGLYRDRVPGVPAAEAPYWVGVALFEDVLDRVRDRAGVGVTFDDANASDAELALPALRARGLRAEFFLLADRLDRPGYLSTAQVRELVGAGMGIGNHGFSHRDWRSLDDRELHRELCEARDQLEEAAGVPILRSACPFGGYDRRVLRALRRAGYERVYTSDGGATKPGAWLQPRNSLRQSDDLSSVEALLRRRESRGGHLRRDLRVMLKTWR